MKELETRVKDWMVTNLISEYNRLIVPSFQRPSGQWSNSMKQNLIKNLIYREVPVITSLVLGKVANAKNNLLIDGLQRLSTIMDFHSNKLAVNEQDNKIYFRDLTDEQKDNFLKSTLPVVEILNLEDEEHAHKIFSVLNNGIPLNKFQRIKGSKECARLVEMTYRKDGKIQEVLKLLGFNIKKEDVKQERAQAVVSAACLSKDPKFKPAATYKSQASNSYWEVSDGGTRRIDKYSKYFSNSFFWTKLYEVLNEKGFSNVGNYLKTDGARFMFLYTIMSLGSDQILRQSIELKTALNDGKFEEPNVLGASRQGGSDATSRKVFFETISSLVQSLLENQMPRKFSKEQKQRLFTKQQGKCGECELEMPSINHAHADHIIPFSKGGNTDEDNLQILCVKCNLKKGNKIKENGQELNFSKF